MRESQDLAHPLVKLIETMLKIGKAPGLTRVWRVVANDGDLF
jgi:hypothetical protein